MSKIWWVNGTEMSPAQLEVVNYAGKGRGFILQGPPGSGKTNVLMVALAAIKSQNQVNSRAIVFTGALQKHIDSGLSYYGLAEGDVITLPKMSREVLREHGREKALKSNQSFEESQSAWRSEFKEMIAGVTHRVYDALLIDESQDFNEEEIEILFKTSGYIAYSIDTNQSIYIRSDKPHPVFALQNREKLRHFDLITHYRVGFNICRFADLLMEGRQGYLPLQGNSQYSEAERPSEVRLEVDFSSDDLESGKIVSRIENQLGVYPGETIGVMFPKREQVHQFNQYCIKNAPKLLELSQQALNEFGANVFIGTIHESKGLEFAVAHVGGLQTLAKFPTQKTLLYTGITRARYACYLTATGRVPDYLESAYKRMNAPEEVAIPDLFAKATK